MNTFQKRFFIAMILLVMIVALSAFTVLDFPQNSPDVMKQEVLTIVSDYVETQNQALLAPDAVLYIAGSDMPLVGQEAIGNFLKSLYHSYGVTLGVDTTVQNITPLSDSIFMVEYSYHGTAFSGEVYPVETMIDSYSLDIPMMSILEIDDGLIVREYLFDATIPEAARINYFSQ